MPLYDKFEHASEYDIETLFKMVQDGANGVGDKEFFYITSVYNPNASKQRRELPVPIAIPHPVYTLLSNCIGILSVAEALLHKQT